jgi:hypothetical protein
MPYQQKSKRQLLQEEYLRNLNNAKAMKTSEGPISNVNHSVPYFSNSTTVHLADRGFTSSSSKINTTTTYIPKSSSIVSKSPFGDIPLPPTYQFTIPNPMSIMDNNSNLQQTKSSHTANAIERNRTQLNTAIARDALTSMMQAKEDNLLNVPNGDVPENNGIDVFNTSHDKSTTNTNNVTIDTSPNLNIDSTNLIGVSLVPENEDADVHLPL